MSTDAFARGFSVVARGIGAGRSASERIFVGARRPRNRLIVIDPTLIAPGGHNFEFAQLISKYYAGRRTVTCYVHRWARPSVVASLNARPIFRTDTQPDAPAAAASAFEERTVRLALALQSIDAADVQAETIAVVHTANVVRLAALAAWYRSVARERRPRLFIQFQVPLEVMIDRPEDRLIALRRMNEAATSLAADGHVRFAANSEALAGRIAAQLGQPCALMPVPVRWPDLDVTPSPPSGVVYGFFGGLRKEKGAALLAPAIAAFTALHPDAQFIIHAPQHDSDAEAVRQLATISQVELIRETFAGKASYFRAMRRARCILLPYDVNAYDVRTSGIFLEAIGLGIPVIVTGGTWMAHELQRRGARGFVMPTPDATALSDALCEAHRALRLTTDAAPVDHVLIAEHTPERFCESIEAVMDPAKA